MTNNQTTELKSLSKLKTAGRLRYWRRTIEIPETELHAICDEIQAEYDNAVYALNKAAGNWAKADAELREKGGGAMSGNLTAEQVCKAIYNSSNYTTYDGARFHASGINMQTIANELNAALSGGWCKCVWNEQEGTFHCSSCDTLLTSEVSIEWPSHKVTPITLPNNCPNCGRKVVEE